MCVAWHFLSVGRCDNSRKQEATLFPWDAEATVAEENLQPLYDTESLPGSFSALLHFGMQRDTTFQRLHASDLRAIYTPF